MHVLWIPSWYPRDEQDMAGSFFREQCEALARSGIALGVLAPYMKTCTQRQTADVFPQEPHEEDGVWVSRFSARQLLASTRVLSARMVAPAMFRAFDAYVRMRGRPDVIHAHSLYPGGFLADLLSRRTGIPWILTEHRSLMHMPLRTPLGRWSERAVVARASVRSAVSDGHTQCMLTRFSSAPGPWVSVPNLLPDMPARSRRPSPYGRVIGHLSLLGEEKRLDLVIGALPPLVEEFDDVVLKIAGPLEGPDGKTVTEMVQASPVADRIELIGALERQQVSDFMASLDVFLLPSDQETFGVVLLESLRQGTPVVATRTWGASSVVGEGDGRLVEIGDRAALVDAVRQLLASPTDEDARRRRADRCVARFGESAFVSRWRTIYGEVQR